MTRKTTALAFLGVLVAGLAVGWTVRTLWPAKAEALEASEPEVKPAEMDVAVVTAPATRGRLPVVEPAVGTVRADVTGSATISSRAGGRVAQVLVNPGAAVHKGEPLLQFDPAPLKAAVAQATAQSVSANNALLELDKSGRQARELELRTAADKAKSELALTQSKLANVKISHAEGLVSDQALAEAQQAAEQAHAEATVAQQALDSFEKLGSNLQRSALEAAAQAAQAALQEAQAALDQATVTAPADGQVATFTVHTGDHAEPGAALGTVVMGQGRVISFGVSSAAAPKVKPGAHVEWTLPGGERQSGTVQAVQDQVDPTTGMVEVLATPESPAPAPAPGDARRFRDSPATLASDSARTTNVTPSALPLGLMVRGEIQVGELPDATLVPRAALIRHEDQPIVVTVAADHLAKIVSVKVLGEHGDQIAVDGPVKPGDKVIIEGGYNLPDGAKVHEGQATTEPAEAALGATDKVSFGSLSVSCAESISSKKPLTSSEDSACQWHPLFTTRPFAEAGA